jgi:energy-coupling factor transport system ATP-binding protein
MTPPLVTVQNVRFTYRSASAPALDGIDLTIQHGEFVAITGAAGAGKTTLCLALCGIVPRRLKGKYEGTVRIGELDVARVSHPGLFTKVGIVFQDPDSQLFSQEVEEEVAFPLENLGVPSAEIERRLTWALELVRLPVAEFRRRFTFALSGGQKQRLALAAVLAVAPGLIILDEPTAALDPIGRAEMFDAIQNLRRDKELTIVMVEHETEHIARYADRVLLMREGRIVDSGPPGRVFSSGDTLERLGVRPPQVVEVTGRLAILGLLPHPSLSVEGAAQTIRAALDHGPSSPFASGVKRQSLQAPESMRRESPPIINVEHVSFQYDRRNPSLVLDDVNLAFHGGEFIALIGQNGSGKSTLARLLNGLLQPTKGRIINRGLDTRTASVSALARHIGYVFQNPDFMISQATVRDEIAFGPRAVGLESVEIEKRVALAAEELGLTDCLSRDPLDLGKGQRERLGVAAILATRAPVLVLDEPTTGQDWRQSLEMLDLARRLNAAGHTIIMITHNMQLVARYARRVIVLARGTVLIDGPPEQVFAQPDLLATTFLEPPQVTQLAQSLPGLPRNILEVDDLVRELAWRLSQARPVG